MSRADELILAYAKAVDACESALRSPHAEPYDFDRAIADREEARAAILAHAKGLRSEAA